MCSHFSFPFQSTLIWHYVCQRMFFTRGHYFTKLLTFASRSYVTFVPSHSPFVPLSINSLNSISLFWTQGRMHSPERKWKRGVMKMFIMMCIVLSPVYHCSTWIEHWYFNMIEIDFKFQYRYWNVQYQYPNSGLKEEHFPEFMIILY